MVGVAELYCLIGLFCIKNEIIVLTDQLNEAP